MSELIGSIAVAGMGGGVAYSIYALRKRDDKNASVAKRLNDNADWVRQQKVKRAVDANLAKKFQSIEDIGLDSLPVARTKLTFTTDSYLVKEESTQGAPFKTF